MKVLKPVKPTSEQLLVIQDTKPGAFVVRGAAGSGKTTTALYRLKMTVRFWQRRHRDGFVTGPIRVLVLSYTRTLRGYIEVLAGDLVTGHDVEMANTTFGKWAVSHLGGDQLVAEGKRDAKIAALGRKISLDPEFLISEVSYVLGRFMPSDLQTYVTCQREGRGKSPHVPGPLRTRILNEVIYPYIEWKVSEGYEDWGDLAVRMALEVPAGSYHVAVVDEAQDFSANQIRALKAHLHPEHSATFVLDAAQRIYPQRFTWTEVGLKITNINSRKLATNFRNTKQIASFAAPLLKNVEVTDDSVIPDFTSCNDSGPVPILVEGRFTRQMDYLIDLINALDPDEQESVGILHAKGGGWFDYVRERLDDAGLAYVELTARKNFPTGPVNIALSTMHSVKGLEFDHVVIVGLNSEVMPHGAEDGDSERDAHLRLLAMAAGRARKTVTLTYKAEEASDLIECLDPATYELVQV